MNDHVVDLWIWDMIELSAQTIKHLNDLLRNIRHFYAGA